MNREESAHQLLCQPGIGFYPEDDDDTLKVYTVEFPHLDKGNILPPIISIYAQDGAGNLIQILKHK